MVDGEEWQSTAHGFQQSSAGIGQGLTVLITSVSASAALKQDDSMQNLSCLLS